MTDAERDLSVVCQAAGDALGAESEDRGMAVVLALVLQYSKTKAEVAALRAKVDDRLELLKRAEARTRTLESVLLAQGRGQKMIDVIDRADACEAEVAALQTQLAQVTEHEYELRKSLWLGHGHSAMVYGDDGEMQCNVLGCNTDFKRQSVWDCVAAYIRATSLPARVAAVRSTACFILTQGPFVSPTAAVDAAIAAFHADQKETPHD